MAANAAGCEPPLPPKIKCGRRALRWRKLLNIAGLKPTSEDIVVIQIRTKEEERSGGIV